MGVDNNAKVWVLFTEDMDKNLVEQSLSLSEEDSGSKVDFQNVWEGSKKIILTPDRPLKTSRKYRLYLKESAADGNGNKLSVPFILVFTVNSDNTLPAVSSLTVQNLTEGTGIVVPYITPANMNSMDWKPLITIQFSEAMDTNLAVAGLILQDMPAEYEWQNSDSTLLIHLTRKLEYGKKYTVMINPTVTDKAGNNLREQFTKEFYIGNDFTHPEVLSMILRDGANSPVEMVSNSAIAENISKTTPVQFTFSKLMDRASVQTSLSLSPDLNYTLSWSENGTQDVLTLTLFENNEFDFGKTYTITIGKDAKDREGNTFLEDFKKVFLIGTDYLSSKITAISVVNTSGSAQNILEGDVVKNIPLKPVITLVFSKPMQASSTQTAVSFTPSISSSLIYYSWSSDLKTLTVTVDEKLDYGELYQISVSSNAKDSTETVTLDKTYKGFFYIGDPTDFLALDTASPVVDLNGGTWPNAVSLTPSLKITFNKTISPESVVDKIEISPSITIKRESVEVSGNYILLHIPQDTPLSAGTTYQLKILKDISADNVLKTPMAEDEILYFTTGSSEEFKIMNLWLDVDNSGTKNSGDVVFINNGIKSFPDTFTSKVNVQTDGSSNKYLYLYIEFSGVINPDTVFNSISLTKESGSGSINPILQNHEFLPSIQNAVKVKVQLYKLDSPGFYYSVKISGLESGIKSSTGIALPENAVVVFGTQ